MYAVSKASFPWWKNVTYLYVDDELVLKVGPGHPLQVDLEQPSA